MKALLKLVSMVLVAALGAGAAMAEEFPTKLVRIVIPYPPGGSAEQQARILAQVLSETWKQPVIVENKPGAGTTIGAAYVAKEAADGYTVYFASTSHAISASLYRNLTYDAVKSFAPISLVAVSPLILSVHPSVKANTMQELIALAKANPGKLNYGSSGSGASPHLAAELFRSRAHIQAVHVPFKGTSPALTALLGDQIDYLFADVAAIPLYKANKLKALAVSTAKRSSLLPDVPTVAEQGIPGYEVANWSSLLAPAGTPPEVVERFNTAVVAALKRPDVRERYRAQGYETIGSTPEELGKYLASEVKKYGEIVAEAKIRID
jgi:tripartite-type tricarboxylate transporter receptor subunit TctC